MTTAGRTGTTAWGKCGLFLWGLFILVKRELRRLYQHGMSEGALAQLADGGVMAVMRHCTILPNSTLSQCIRVDVDDRTALSTSLVAPGVAGGFDPNFRLAYAVSHDGGAKWTPIKAHPDLVTPMCQSDMVGTESGVVLVSTPYAETVRANMSVLASDDSGTSFHRQLRVWSGHCGYSALVCGLPGELDCGVAFDRYWPQGGEGGFSHITFARFSSSFHSP